MRLSESEILARLNGHDLAVAAVNAPSLCVVTGPLGALDSFARPSSKMSASPLDDWQPLTLSILQ